MQRPDVYQGRQDRLDFMPETTFTVKLPVLQHIGMAYSTRFSAHDIDRTQLDSRPRQVASVALASSRSIQDLDRESQEDFTSF